MDSGSTYRGREIKATGNLPYSLCRRLFSKCSAFPPLARASAVRECFTVFRFLPTTTSAMLLDDFYMSRSPTSLGDAMEVAFA